MSNDTWSPVVVLSLWIVDPAPLSVMLASSVTMVTLSGSSRIEPASTVKAPPVRVLPERLVKIVGSIVTVSPLETARVPELVNVGVSIVNAPPLEAPVIVPLFVRDFPKKVSWLLVPDCVMAPWLTMPSRA